ncbi:hypothetical protein TNCV_2150871 [Trichonephila clavipes]|nr:hypothetical protein TNCV_2150871 [Trichonephila clavipes]
MDSVRERILKSRDAWRKSYLNHRICENFISSFSTSVSRLKCLVKIWLEAGKLLSHRMVNDCVERRISHILKKKNSKNLVNSKQVSSQINYEHISCRTMHRIPYGNRWAICMLFQSAENKTKCLKFDKPTIIGW